MSQSNIALINDLTTDEVKLASSTLADGMQQTELFIPDMRCGGCLNSIETELAKTNGVTAVRANLSAKTVRVSWSPSIGPGAMLDVLSSLGFTARLANTNLNTKDLEVRHYLKALAVAGFAAGNIMLLSVSVWSGADETTRAIFHWLSAFIAIPALIYSARVFYVSAWRAIKAGRSNMDVPITVGIVLTCLLGLYDTAMHGEQVYFEASVMLVFFLLVGRTLDHMMRKKASNAADGLSALIPNGVTLMGDGNEKTFVPLCDIKVGDSLFIDVNQRIPLDGWVESGVTELDCSLLTGESLPQTAERGTEVLAGMLNLSAPIGLHVTATQNASFVERTRRLMEEAKSSKGHYHRLADRAAKLYAPLVHSLAAISFFVWYIANQDVHQAATIAVAVLIITCPCALGLAVPMVQVMAARRLFDQGVLMKDGAALEKLNSIDTVVFDKTGTLTSGTPELLDAENKDLSHLRLAAELAQHSAHPFSKVIVAEFRKRVTHNQPSVELLTEIKELSGKGIEAKINNVVLRLGKTQWAIKGTEQHKAISQNSSQTILTLAGELLAVYAFQDKARPDALQAVQALKEHSIQTEILSGDNQQQVQKLATTLSIANAKAEKSPEQKAVYIKRLIEEGHSVLMVGDGLNDTIALTQATVSMAPGTAADTGRQASDFVFIHDNLMAVPQTLAIAKKAHRLIKQNFAIAIAYNLIAIPFAIAGAITPLVAAIAMSASSIVVVANAMRLREASKVKSEHQSSYPSQSSASSLQRV